MEHNTKLNESAILARRHSHVDQLAERHEVTGVKEENVAVSSTQQAMRAASALSGVPPELIFANCRVEIADKDRSVRGVGLFWHGCGMLAIQMRRKSAQGTR
jgi:hypothetical protein